MKNLHEFSDADFAKVRLGDNFITVLPPDHNPQAKSLQEAVKQEVQIRKVKKALQKGEAGPRSRQHTTIAQFIQYMKFTKLHKTQQPSPIRVATNHECKKQKHE